MDDVDCPECGHRYDSDENPFCPRCGSLGRAAAEKPDVATVARQDPTRRRVQGAGLVLIVVASLWAMLLIGALIAAPTLMGPVVPLLEGQEGGTLDVRVTEDGAPVANATVILTSPAGGRVYQNATTDADGHARFDLSANAAVNVTIVVGELEFQRRAVALAGYTASVHVDVATDEAVDEHWNGIGPLVQGTRIFAGFLLAMYAFVAFAGVAALRLRWRGVAVGGSAVAAIPALILAFAAPNIGTLLMLVIAVAAFAMIMGGRRHFT